MNYVRIAVCAAMTMLAAPAMATTTHTDQQVIVRWQKAQDSCTGNGPSKKAYPEACAVRDRHSASLEERGWCRDPRIEMWTPCLALRR